MNTQPIRPEKRTNVRAWFAPEVVLAEVRRRWAAWPVRFDLDVDLDLDLCEEDLLADLRAGRS